MLKEELQLISGEVNDLVNYFFGKGAVISKSDYDYTVDFFNKLITTQVTKALESVRLGGKCYDHGEAGDAYEDAVQDLNEKIRNYLK